ncbi:hypothetical protein XAR_2864 [Xanthomonas citri pv. glycines str. 8ra]|nr:hypothetical protein XAR_2864 [Xanthomonas citri pv. glycines str. 8ra]
MVTRPGAWLLCVNPDKKKPPKIGGREREQVSCCSDCRLAVRCAVEMSVHVAFALPCASRPIAC